MSDIIKDVNSLTQKNEKKTIKIKYIGHSYSENLIIYFFTKNKK